MIAPKIRGGTKMHILGPGGGLYGDVRSHRWPRRVFQKAHNRSLEDGFTGYVICGWARRGYGCAPLLATRGRKKDGSREYGTANSRANFMLHNPSCFIPFHVFPEGPLSEPRWIGFGQAADWEPLTLQDALGRGSF